MRDLTQEELDQLVILGQEELLDAIGANIVRKLMTTENMEDLIEKKMLEAMPTGEMGNA